MKDIKDPMAISQTLPNLSPQYPSVFFNQYLNHGNLRGVYPPLCYVKTPQEMAGVPY